MEFEVGDRVRVNSNYYLAAHGKYGKILSFGGLYYNVEYDSPVNGLTKGSWTSSSLEFILEERELISDPEEGFFRDGEHFVEKALKMAEERRRKESELFCFLKI